MCQDWTELIYAHWDHDPDVVQALLPAGLRVDTFEGRAWVGLVPFVMRDIRLPRTPALGWVSTFPEVNVRTYVVDPAGRRAVWFFSLDVPRSPAVLVARAGYRLPYCWARARLDVDGELRRYVSRRRRPHRRRGGMDLTVRIGDPIPAGSETDLDMWLTARWGLVAGTRRRLRHAPVDHPRWPLRHAELVHLDQDLVQAAGLPPPAGNPRILYSAGVSVRVGLPRTVTADATPGEVRTGIRGTLSR